MLPSLQGIYKNKNSILSRGFVDQRILLSDWQESLLATSNEKWKSQIPPFLHSYLNTTHLKYRLILSRDIGDQRILHSDWMRDTHDHVKPKVIASLAAFLTIYMQKSKDIIWFFPEKLMNATSCSLIEPAAHVATSNQKRYCWSKNLAI